MKQIQAYAAAPTRPSACSGLANFISLVNAQTGKKLTANQAASFATQAQDIKAALGSPLTASLDLHSGGAAHYAPPRRRSTETSRLEPRAPGIGEKNVA